MQRRTLVTIGVAGAVALFVIGSGSVAFAVNDAERRAAVAAYLEAYGAASAALTDAQSAQTRWETSEAAAIEAVALAESVQGAGMVDGDDTADLARLVGEVRLLLPPPAELPVLPQKLPESTPGLPAETGDLRAWLERLESWSADAGVIALDGAVAALRAGTFSTAATAVPAGQAVLDGNGDASEETRASLAAALEGLRAALAERTDPVEELAAVATAAQAVRDSAAAPKPRTICHGGPGTGTWLPSLLPGFPPTYVEFPERCITVYD